MSWLRSLSQQQQQQQHLPRSQREASPLQVACSLSQASQTSASRVLGADITNRSPTPTPSTHSARKKKTSISPVSPCLTIEKEHGGERAAVAADDGSANRSAPTASSFVLPSYETFLDAMGEPQGDQSAVPPPPTRRRSRSPDGATGSAHAACLDEKWKSWTGRERQNSTEERTTERIDSGVDAHQPCKRARLHADTAFRTRSPISPHLTSHGTWEGDMVEKDAESFVHDLISFDQRIYRETSGNGTGSSAFFTPISTNLLFNSGASNGKSAMELERGSSLENALPVLQREEQQGENLPLLRGVSAQLALSPFAHRAMQRETAGLCKPARLLDTTLPSWQVLAVAAAAGAEERKELLATTPQGDRRVRIVNAVDSTVVYSPGSLEDISPILCLSEDSAMQERNSARAANNQSTPPHFQNEEASRQKKSRCGSCDTSAEISASYSPLFPANHGDEEEEGQPISLSPADVDGTHAQRPHPREDILRFTSDAFEELQRSLLCWQR